MVKEIVERKTVIVTKVSTTLEEFQYFINCPFQPDEVIFRSLSFKNNGATTSAIFLINSDLVDNYDIVGFSNSDLTYPLKIKFPINQPINKSFTFNIKNGNGSLFTVSLNGEISLALEFIKYK